MKQYSFKRTSLFSALVLACALSFAMPATQARAQEEAERALPSSTATDMPEPTATTGHEAAENIGFPQFNATTYASQIFWLLVAFAFMYGLMSKVALPKVAAVVDARAAQRENDIKTSATAHEEAEKVKKAYDAMLAKAHGEAQSLLLSTETDISEKIAEESARFSEHVRKRMLTAEQNVARAKEDALQSIADIASDVATDIVLKVASVQVNKTDARRIVSALMQKA